MNPGGDSRVAQLDRLLEAALELDGEARARFLASGSVAADLREELAALLAGAADGSTIDRAHAGLLAAAADLFQDDRNETANAPGQRIGRYRLLRPLGDGGMATVWLAERDDGSFDHQVAVKCMKVGLATAESRSRFLREQQILARMQHPNIARLYDAGISEEDVPYIVMEWIDGLPLTQWCDRQQLPIAPRLRLFQKVCAAVAYSHRNLIVHRDLKPGNILVGADGEPKLLDFGIAKSIAEDADTRTHSGVRMLTPDYAAPEQFSGSAVTTATDIYSLGLILYELLCGLRPRAVAAPAAALAATPVTAPSEALRRLSDASASGDATASDQFASIAKARRNTPAHLGHGLRGDLDTIVLTASQEEPARRYPTVEALREDIGLYLGQQPIRARPDTLRYRTRKFLRRNRFMVAAGLAVALALVGGLIASLWQARIAVRERERAELAQRQAEQRFEDVRGLAHAMIFELHDALLKVPGSTAARSLLVKQALIYLQRLDASNTTSIPLRQELADAWLRVGDLQGAPGSTNLGDTRGALRSYANADTSVAAILRQSPGDRNARRMHALIVLHRAFVEYDANALTASEASFREAVALWSGLQKEHEPRAAQGLANSEQGLANLLEWTDQHSAALPWYGRAEAAMLAKGPGDRPEDYALFLAGVEINQGEDLDWLGRHAEAATMLQSALQRLQKLQQGRPDDPEVIHLESGAWMKLGDNLFGTQDKQARLIDYQNALAQLTRLAAADPADIRAKGELAQADQEVAEVLGDLGRNDQAMKLYEDSVHAEREIVAHDPDNQEVRHDLSNAWYGIGGLYKAEHQDGQAVVAFREALGLRQSLLDQDPKAMSMRRDVAQVLGDLADTESDERQACRDWIAGDAFWAGLAAEDKIMATDRKDAATAHRHAVACR